jgi:predicted ArsR family transcriptional regulator
MTVRRDEQHAALASPIRREVLSALDNASAPLDASAIAEQFNVHVTTARFHLEQLERAGLVRRVVQREGSRGRPRIAFEAAPRSQDEDALRQLNSVLIDALASDPDGGRDRARAAGERWSSAYENETADHTVDTVEPLMRIFDQLGFEPELDADSLPSDEGQPQRVLALHGCPFRDLAVEHPDVVCSAHRGLMEGTLRHLGRDASDATLRPFVEPDLCTVLLRGSLATH